MGHSGDCAGQAKSFAWTSGIMALPIGRLLALLLTVTMLAGCASSALQTELPDPAVQVDAAPPAAAETATAPQRPAAAVQGEERREIYAFAGHIVGANPPDYMGQGPASSTVGAARYDGLHAPEGTLRLEFALDSLEGTGIGRVEVLDDDGDLVYMSDTWTSTPGKVGAGGGHRSAWVADHADPGSYSIRYYIAGSFDITFRGTAVVRAGSPDPQPGSVPARSHSELAIWSGRLLAPDPFLAESGYCPDYVNLVGDLTEHVTWERFYLGRGAVDGWGFRVEGAGMLAEPRGAFPAVKASAEGIVPDGASWIAVCSRSATNTEFRLVLTPPDALVLKGRLLAPHPEWYDNGSCGSMTGLHSFWADLDNVVFTLDGDHGGWSYGFDRTGLESSLGESSGTVLPGTERIVVCSPQGVATAFVLTLLPPGGA